MYIRFVCHPSTLQDYQVEDGDDLGKEVIKFKFKGLIFFMLQIWFKKYKIVEYNIYFLNISVQLLGRPLYFLALVWV